MGSSWDWIYKRHNSGLCIFMGLECSTIYFVGDAAFMVCTKKHPKNNQVWPKVNKETAVNTEFTSFSVVQVNNLGMISKPTLEMHTLYFEKLLLLWPVFTNYMHFSQTSKGLDQNYLRTQLLFYLMPWIVDF